MTVELNQFTFDLYVSLSKSTNYSGLKGWVSMLPWHAIPFLKGLGMLTPNPWENGWPRLWRSCNWQKNTQLNHSMAPKEPYRESEWADVSPLLKYISGAVAPRLKAPKGPYQASLCNPLISAHYSVKTSTSFWRKNASIVYKCWMLHWLLFQLAKKNPTKKEYLWWIRNRTLSTTSDTSGKSLSPLT